MADKPKTATPNSRIPMTDEERRARYDLLRRKSNLSPIYAKHKNPDWVVRWVFAGKNQQDITLHNHLGFEFAKDDTKAPESERQIDTVVPLSEDGCYRTGDVVLMQIPKIDYDFYLAENARRSKELMNMGKDGFKTDAQRLTTTSGNVLVRTFDRDESGIPQFHK